MLKSTTNKKEPIVAWYTVCIFMLVYTMSFVDRFIISLLIEPIKQDLQINDTQISILHGFSFALFYSLLGVPIAYLADRTNRRNLIIAGVSLWSAMTVACGLTKNYGVLFAARMGVGIGEAALSPAAYSMIADIFPREKLSRALSIYGIGVVAGSGFAFILGGMIVEFAAKQSLFSIPIIGDIKAWQLSFIVAGLVTFLLLIPLATIREPSRTGFTTQLDSNLNNNQAQNLKQLLLFIKTRKACIISYMLSFSFTSLAAYSYLAWLPSVLIRESGLSAGQAGITFGSIILLAGTAGTICGGSLADFLFKQNYKDAPLRVGLITAAGITLSAVMSIFLNNEFSQLVVISIAIFFFMLPLGVIPAGLNIIAPSRMRAQLSALLLLSANLIGMGLGPSCVALLVDYVLKSETAVSTALAIVCSIGGTLAILCLLYGRKHYINCYNAMLEGKQL